MSRAKGSLFERLVADYLRDELGNPNIDRAPLKGSRDIGDISGVTWYGQPVVIECKNQQAMQLGSWLRQAESERQTAGAAIGAVVHKRPRHGQAKDQYVTLPLSQFTQMLAPRLPDTPELLVHLIETAARRLAALPTKED